MSSAAQQSVHVTPYEGDAGAWDAVVRQHHGWTAFHLHGWKTVMERALGHTCVYLGARTEDGTLAGVLPLVRVRSRVFGDFLVSMPFLNYGGPLGTPGAVKALGEHATRIAAEAAVDLLELRCREEAPIDLPVSHRKITVLMDLEPGAPEHAWNVFPAKLRSQIRRSMKEGVSVRFGPDQVPAFYEVFARHMRDLGTPVLSRRVFEEIAAVFGDAAWFGCAYHEAVPVACGAGFRWGDEFEMTWASSLREYNRIAPNMLLYWRFMERAAADGVSTFNFGRCTPGGGTHRFKRQWGGRDHPLPWYQWSAGGRVETPNPDAGAFAWGPRVWKRLPVRVANVLGPRIVRFIP